MGVGLEGKLFSPSRK